MVEGLFQERAVDGADTEAAPGFRLHALEVLNWGTFDREVWALEPAGRNTLLTGDIGSGKSTLVDAVTTLLLPPGRIAYNRAAGAERRERSLASYVRGHHRTERDPSTGSPRPVALREEDAVSVLLGRFHHAGLDRWVTLAQVFWHSGRGGAPERLHVTAQERLSVAEDFTGFGDRIDGLKRRLRGRTGVELHATQRAYSAWFRRQMGIPEEAALELFHQTVSMKAVGDLTGFVREHMLGSFDAHDDVQALVDHFEDLRAAHAAVQKARRQLERLEPIVDDCDAYDAGRARAGALRACRDALGAWFAGHRVRLVVELLGEWRSKLAKQTARREKLAATRDGLADDAADLKAQIAASGGDRIEQLGRDIDRFRREVDQRRVRAAAYAAPLKVLRWVVPGDADAFAAVADRARRRQAERGSADADAHNELADATMAERDAKKHRRETEEELESLRLRRSNIDARQVAIRQRICAGLRLDTADMPFAAELIRVREGESAWEGAAERLLRPFGLSLLVPEAAYAAVARWVDGHHLRGRLVYYRVPAVEPTGPAAAGSPRSSTLAAKVEVKPDSPLRGWVRRELSRRADLACCESTEDPAFTREPQAVTRAGQIKGRGGRHEKDDRSAVDDRSRYVLGWDNRLKIGLLEARLERDAAEEQQCTASLAAAQRRLTALNAEFEAVAVVLTVGSFGEVDPAEPEAEAANAQAEKQRLEASSDILATLTQQLSEVRERQTTIGTQHDKLTTEVARTAGRIEQLEAQEREDIDLAEAGRPEHDGRFEDAARLVDEHADGGLAGITIENARKREAAVREACQRLLDNEAKKLDTLRDRVVRRMTEYRRDFPEQTQELDASIDAGAGYRALLGTLRDDDLPRFEDRFRRMLHENTIQEVAAFQAELDRRCQVIQDRIERINGSLLGIDYNPGRFIRLETRRTPDARVRDFREDLRACTTNALTPDPSDDYPEEAFLRVRSLIDRFRGREGESESDRRWTEHVTDVRNWFEFAASERWRETDEEHEHYADSGGKSGGQKEKLAYTVLGASLAYRFGLERNGSGERTFRFVMIDEAFGRGSDESAGYGLRLFRELGLQLLIVTPLQKIRAIEPHVSAVGFVDNPDGSASRLRNLTVRAFREEREAAAGAAGADRASVPDPTLRAEASGA